MNEDDNNRSTSDDQVMRSPDNDVPMSGTPTDHNIDNAPTDCDAPPIRKPSASDVGSYIMVDRDEDALSDESESASKKQKLNPGTVPGSVAIPITEKPTPDGTTLTISSTPNDLVSVNLGHKDAASDPDNNGPTSPTPSKGHNTVSITMRHPTSMAMATNTSPQPPTVTIPNHEQPNIATINFTKRL